MKKIVVLLSALCVAASLSGQVNNPEYDPSLATKLGADDLGMKMYILVILRTGPNNEQDTAKRARLFEGHFSNINRLAEQKKLIFAGPLDENDQSYRGIFILDIPSFEEAKKLLNDDPTVKEKIFEPEYFHLYGSAALPEHLEIHKKIRKRNP